MATPETALTSGSTSGDSPATNGTPGTDLAPASTSGSDNGVGAAINATAEALATDQTAVQQPAELDTILGSIPADDADLQQYQNQAAYQALVSTRGQLRVLSNAVRELQPLETFREFGDPAAIKTRLQTHQLLFSPQRDAEGKPIVDPVTRTTYTTARPLIEHLDKNSPGTIEQLMVDLAAYPFDTGMTDEQGRPIREPGFHQLLRFFKLNPARLAEYQNIDALIQRTSGAITPEELAEIPAEYHAAYRIIPAGVRNAWKSLDEAEQIRLLEDYKGKIESAQREKDREARDKADEQRRIAEYNARVSQEQEKYLDTIRRERTASLIQSLAKQVQFSTDPVINQVMFGTLAASMAQLFDSVWRFVVVDEVLKPLGISLDQEFDTALEKFDHNAAQSVALRMAGDTARARDAADDANSAANFLMAKIAILALKVAQKQGASAVEQATRQGTALAAATQGRPAPGNGSSPTGQQGVLPPGIRPGSREAIDFIAQQTGYVRPAGV